MRLSNRRGVRPSLHLAGMLQYSEQLRERIEKWLLAVYAPVFIESLEEVAADSEKRLASLKDTVRQLGRIVDRIEDDPDTDDVRDLFTLMQQVGLANAIQLFGIRPHRMVVHAGRGDRQRLEKYVTRLREMLHQVTGQAEHALGDEAKGMREDIETWRQHVDPDVAETAADLKNLKPLEIKLEEEQFPFLDDKFKRNVRKLRGDEAGLFDNMSSIKIELARLPMGALGVWAAGENELVVAPPRLKPYEALQDELDHTLTHELTHLTQTLMAKALGLSHYVRNPDTGEWELYYQPGPGMAPKALLNPKLTQKIMLMAERNPEAKKLLDQIEAERGMGGRAVYDVDDLEFYTHLGDTVRDFKKLAKKNPEWTEEQRRLATDIFLGRIKLPQTRAGAKKWIEGNDPDHAVWPAINQPHPWLASIKVHSPGKFRKAMQEFTKATAGRRGEVPKAEGVEKLWEKFLDERYDGGKAKVTNPNPDTRDSHPEITVAYLMGRDKPVYQSARRRIRQEFSRWRGGKGPRAPAPAAPSGLGIFAPP
jgi:hypothetical protein